MESYFDVYRERTPGSERLFKRAREVMPGGISHGVHFFPPYPFYVKGAEGSKVWDVDGNEYVDLWMGHYTHILGHHPREIVEGIEKELRERIHWGIVFEKQIELAELIRDLVPCAEMVRFCCSGTESTMYAVRIARAHTRKNVILKIAGGWHGANSELTYSIKMPYDKPETLGLLPELQHYGKAIPYNDIDGTLQVIRENQEDLAGIILEPVSGEGGFIPAAIDYLRMLRSETERLGAVLIFDEVITGFRISLGGAQAKFGVIPDLTTLGKIVGGGMPVGAVVGKREILEKTSPEIKGNKWEKIMVGGGTFSSHPLTVAAGLAMLNYLRVHAHEVYPLLEEKGEKVRQGVERALRQNGVNGLVTGTGSLYQTHFPLVSDAVLDSPHSIHRLTNLEKKEVEFRLRMMNHGVHVMHGGGALSLAHSEGDIARIIEAAGEVAREMAEERKGSS